MKAANEAVLNKAVSWIAPLTVKVTALAHPVAPHVSVFPLIIGAPVPVKVPEAAFHDPDAPVRDNVVGGVTPQLVAALVAPEFQTILDILTADVLGVPLIVKLVGTQQEAVDEVT